MSAVSLPTLRRPQPLPREGWSVTALALSGRVEPERLSRGAARLRSLGVGVWSEEACWGQWRYFAGDDEARLAALEAALRDPAPVVLFARGGFGLSRLLHRIDWAAVAASGKVFCGFSDVTAFSLAALAQAGYVTFAGPMLAAEFALEDEAPQVARARTFTERHFFGVLGTEGTYAYPVCEGDVAQGRGVVEGTLWGTSLSLLAHLVGTPWLPQFDGGILVLEDVGEAPYRVERMLWQLQHAGVLARQRAIVLGQFSEAEPLTGRPPYAMEAVVETLRAMVDCPVFTDFPFGHVPAKLTLPIGARARLSWEGRGYALSVGDYWNL